MSTDTREKLAALRDVAGYRPALTALVLVTSLATAFLAGVGVGFILPILEFVQADGPPTDAGGLLGVFVDAYALLGVPFTLEYLLIGLAAVMTLRFALRFVVGWLRAILSTGYQRELRRRLFEAISVAPLSALDDAGSDALLNSLVTETNRASTAVTRAVDVVESGLQGLVYLGLAALLAPVLTLVALVALGVSTALTRFVLEPAYVTGDRVADANERLQTVFQQGVQGIRDVRLYNRGREWSERVGERLDRFVDARVRLARNRVALNNLNQLTNALVVFALIYLGVRFTGLSLGEIGVFLFAVFRLSPAISQVNIGLYRLSGTLPNVVRVRSRIHALKADAATRDTGTTPISTVGTVEFDDVTFAYGEEPVLRELSLSVEQGETVALVGPSGAGKSTAVSLLGRLRDPDAGEIRANGTPIGEYDLADWRECVAIVRQQPFVFDATLRENVAMGDPDADDAAMRRACEVARVTEFLPELPDGLDSALGEDGVRLSGGQRQRVAIARAVLAAPDLLVLDEATSEVDATLEREIHDELAGMEREIAVLSIAHRLSTVSDADRIYVLEDGQVVQVGDHEGLLAEAGRYADLYASQS